MSSNLPERVLQFGTGILLRGLPDYFINQANAQGVFNGSILVVKSTPGSTNEFSREGCVFTTCVRGLYQGQRVSENVENHAISRVVSAIDEWPAVLAAAANPAIRIIISNTTEVGIQYQPESIHARPPASFPARLAAVLFERFGHPELRESTIVIVPTELIPDNGDALASIVKKLALFNELPSEFISWLNQRVLFCNSLVDRIVTRPSEATQRSLPAVRELTIQTEPYKLWAIQGSEEVRELLSFASVCPEIIIAPSIEYYRERKLRILNGGGTIAASIGFLRGLNTFYECMTDPYMSKLIESVVLDEIEPTLPDETRQDSRQFAFDVLERWRNPETVHYLLNITLQATAKTRMRNVPTILRHWQKFKRLPEIMLDGFAAHLYFTRPLVHRDGSWFGLRKGQEYRIQDDQAGFFYENWTQVVPNDRDSVQKFVAAVCANEKLWGADLSKLEGFVNAISCRLQTDL